MNYFVLLHCFFHFLVLKKAKPSKKCFHTWRTDSPSVRWLRPPLDQGSALWSWPWLKVGFTPVILFRMNLNSLEVLSKRKSLQVKERYFVYLQNVKGVDSDAQAVKDGQYIFPTPDFRGALKSPFRHQALAFLDPAITLTKDILSKCD